MWLCLLQDNAVTKRLFLPWAYRVLVLTRVAILQSVPPGEVVGISPQDVVLLAGIFLEDASRWILMVNSPSAQKRFHTATLK